MEWSISTQHYLTYSGAPVATAEKLAAAAAIGQVLATYPAMLEAHRMQACLGLPGEHDESAAAGAVERGSGFESGCGAGAGGSARGPAVVGTSLPPPSGRTGLTSARHRRQQIFACRFTWDWEEALREHDHMLSNQSGAVLPSVASGWSSPRSSRLSPFASPWNWSTAGRRIKRLPPPLPTAHADSRRSMQSSRRSFDLFGRGSAPFLLRGWTGQAPHATAGGEGGNCQSHPLPVMNSVPVPTRSRPHLEGHLGSMDQGRVYTSAGTMSSRALACIDDGSGSTAPRGGAFDPHATISSAPVNVVLQHSSSTARQQWPQCLPSGGVGGPAAMATVQPPLQSVTYTSLPTSLALNLRQPSCVSSSWRLRPVALGSGAGGGGGRASTTATANRDDELSPMVTLTTMLGMHHPAGGSNSGFLMGSLEESISLSLRHQVAGDVKHRVSRNAIQWLGGAPEHLASRVATSEVVTGMLESQQQKDEAYDSEQKEEFDLTPGHSVLRPTLLPASDTQSMSHPPGTNHPLNSDFASGVVGAVTPAVRLSTLMQADAAAADSQSASIGSTLPLRRRGLGAMYGSTGEGSSGAGVGGAGCGVSGGASGGSSGTSGMLQQALKHQQIYARWEQQHQQQQKQWQAPWQHRDAAVETLLASSAFIGPRDTAQAVCMMVPSSSSPGFSSESMVKQQHAGSSLQGGPPTVDSYGDAQRSSSPRCWPLEICTAVQQGYHATGNPDHACHPNWDAELNPCAAPEGGAASGTIYPEYTQLGPVKVQSLSTPPLVVDAAGATCEASDSPAKLAMVRGAAPGFTHRLGAAWVGENAPSLPMQQKQQKHCVPQVMQRQCAASARVAAPDASIGQFWTSRAPWEQGPAVSSLPNKPNPGQQGALVLDVAMSGGGLVVGPLDVGGVVGVVREHEEEEDEDGAALVSGVTLNAKDEAKGKSGAASNAAATTVAAGIPVAAHWGMAARIAPFAPPPNQTDCRILSATQQLVQPSGARSSSSSGAAAGAALCNTSWESRLQRPTIDGASSSVYRWGLPGCRWLGEAGGNMARITRSGGMRTVCQQAYSTCGGCGGGSALGADVGAASGAMFERASIAVSPSGSTCCLDPSNRSVLLLCGGSTGERQALTSWQMYAQSPQLQMLRSGATATAVAATAGGGSEAVVGLCSGVGSSLVPPGDMYETYEHGGVCSEDCEDSRATVRPPAGWRSGIHPPGGGGGGGGFGSSVVITRPFTCLGSLAAHSDSVSVHGLLQSVVACGTEGSTGAAGGAGCRRAASTAYTVLALAGAGGGGVAVLTLPSGSVGTLSATQAHSACPNLDELDVWRDETYANPRDGVREGSDSNC